LAESNTASTDRYLSAARERQEELVRLTCDLIAAVSVNPPGDEHRPAAVVEKFLKGLGVTAARYEPAPGRTSLIAAIGKPGGRRLLVPLHLDTVPAPEDSFPGAFRPRAEGGLIVGRGAVDDKGPLAAVLMAMAILLKDPKPLGGELVLVAAADEECGNRQGMDQLVGRGLIKGDWALVPDIGHSMGAVDVAEKGLAFIEISCRGRSAHGSRPADGANAILALAELLAEIEAWDPAERHPLLGRPTANVGTVSGGSAPNMVADRAVAQIDCRYLPGMTAAGPLRHFEELGRRVAARRDGVAFSLRVVSEQPPMEIDTASPLVQAVREIAPRITGRPVELLGMGGTTLCKPCVAAGVTAVGFSPGAAAAAHTAGESVEVRELVEFAAFTAALARHLLG
jgi:acetylornithine deacetylase/succinyl-diaminopimelate desuccinylase-like protein